MRLLALHTSLLPLAPSGQTSAAATAADSASARAASPGVHPFARQDGKGGAETPRGGERQAGEEREEQHQQQQQQQQQQRRWIVSMLSQRSAAVWCSDACVHTGECSFLCAPHAAAAGPHQFPFFRAPLKWRA